MGTGQDPSRRENYLSMNLSEPHQIDASLTRPFLCLRSKHQPLQRLDQTSLFVQALRMAQHSMCTRLWGQWGTCTQVTVHSRCKEDIKYTVVRNIVKELKEIWVVRKWEVGFGYGGHLQERQKERVMKDETR